jgi:thiopeptide-type bacteriocin biosynthesis protein
MTGLPPRKRCDMRISAEPRRGWLSAHIYFDGYIYGPWCDYLITELLYPFARSAVATGLIERFFYIRYKEQGSHVRLRMDSYSDRLESEVKPALLRHLSDTRISNVPGNGAHAAERVSLKWVPYQAEVERYGGPEAIAVAESFFCYSTETCVDMLRGIAGKSQSTRLGKALLAFVVILHTFCDDRSEASRLVRRYRGTYLRNIAGDESGRTRWLELFEDGFDRQAEILHEYVNDAWERMDHGDSLSEALDDLHGNLKHTRSELERLAEHGAVFTWAEQRPDWLHCVHTIIPSYIHMTSNRLGVTIYEESYLAHLLQRTFDTDTGQRHRL